jgi:hypothetical protein
LRLEPHYRRSVLIEVRAASHRSAWGLHISLHHGYGIAKCQQRSHRTLSQPHFVHGKARIVTSPRSAPLLDFQPKVVEIFRVDHG